MKWWASNRPRIEQQVALGALGPFERIMGGISPVVILDDVSELSSGSTYHVFGGWCGGTAGLTAALEINTPMVATTSVSVLRVFGQITNGARSEMVFTIRDPSPATGLSTITSTATELDDGWNALAQSHQCRVFIGFAPTGLINVAAAGTVTDAKGAPMEMAGVGVNWTTFGERGMLIPRGRNLVAHHSDWAGVPSGATFTWGVILRETRAPGGPV